MKRLSERISGPAEAGLRGATFLVGIDAKRNELCIRKPDNTIRAVLTP